MFSRKDSEYYFTKALRYGLIEERKYEQSEYETSFVGMEALVNQAKAAGKRADLYWAAFIGRTHPIEPLPHQRRYHNPPRLEAA